jgi:pimeloyl-ACP methyl ester carboxylesterase
MPINETALTSLRVFEDRDDGFSEEFLSPRIGGASTLAALTRPIENASSTGWVVCHSFGLEQLHLTRLEAQLARALAGRGFPVLRYHGQGYGDSERGMEEISLSSHLADAADAVDLMAAVEGVDRVGLIGIRFGAAVAAVVAERKGLPFMVLVDPPARGSQYMRDFLWTGVFAKMLGRQDGEDPSKRVLAELEAKGFADVKGFPLSRRAFEEISAFDLTKELVRFRGAALIAAITRAGKPGPGVSKLAAHLRSLGADCSVEVLTDKYAAEFGQYHFRFLEATGAKRDMRLELDEDILRATVDWCLASAKSEVRL